MLLSAANAAALAGSSGVAGTAGATGERTSCTGPLRQLAGRGLPKAREQGGTRPWLTAALGAHLHVRAWRGCCLRLPRRRQVVACERSGRHAVRVCEGCAAYSRQTAALVGRAHRYSGVLPSLSWAVEHTGWIGGASSRGRSRERRHACYEEENMAICGSRVSRCAVQLQSGAAALRQPKSLGVVCVIRRHLLAPGHAQCLKLTRKLVEGSASHA